MAISIQIEGIEQIRKELDAAELTPQKLRQMNAEIGYAVQEGIADHLSEAAATRHKTADRLGARHTNFLEYASGRVSSVSKFTGNPKPEITTANADETGVDIVFKNTPALRRAFGPITITPKRAKHLTIPQDKVSYARRVAELKAEGHKIFRPYGAHGLMNILAEHTGIKERFKGADGKTHTRNKWRVLYSLVKKATIPQDRGLFPREDKIEEIALDAAEAFIATDML